MNGTTLYVDAAVLIFVYFDARFDALIVEDSFGGGHLAVAGRRGDKRGTVEGNVGQTGKEIDNFLVVEFHELNEHRELGHGERAIVRLLEMFTAYVIDALK